MVLFLFSTINKSALPNESIIALFKTRIQNIETHPCSSALKLKDRNITLKNMGYIYGRMVNDRSYELFL